MKKLFPFLLLLLIGCADKPTQPYVILKVAKTTSGTQFDVQVYSRLSKLQLVAIASKIKKDSSQYDNLQIDYQLPGNSYKNAGGITVYATAAYHDARKVTVADTVNDLHDNRLSFEFNGFTAQQAQKMLAFDPAESKGKIISGKFIDDITRTVSILFKDSDTSKQVYIIELDTTGKVVSATEPMMINQKGVEKLVISPKGDYLTLENDILTMYSIDEPEKPYRSIKAGM